MARLTYPVLQTQTVRRKPGVLRSARIHAGGGGAATLSIYDGISTNGVLLLVIGAAIDTSEESSDSFRPFYHGLHVVVSGSPTHASVDVET